MADFFQDVFNKTKKFANNAVRRKIGRASCRERV